MSKRIFEINRKTGKYEGRDQVAFSNQQAVASRELSEALTREAPSPKDEAQYRRLVVVFVSGHKFVADIGLTYFQNQEVDFENDVAAKALVNSRIPDAEVFRRAIRDFSKQLPVVYEKWSMDKKKHLVITHEEAPKRESVTEQRVLPAELF